MIDESTQRLRIVIRGVVQGVGFRPFVSRLAEEIKLAGWVKNSSQGVLLEIEGSIHQLEIFQQRLNSEKPRHAYIQSLEASHLDAVGYESFEIRKSDGSGEKIALVLPDIATCPDCLLEIFDPTNRRYLYPFTNCTNCGPRFTIIESLPYDRPNTSMKRFAMCEQCQEEYHNPKDRRYHAQPNACPQCGPKLTVWDETGNAVCSGHDAMRLTAEALAEGKVAAVKGLGGFHFMVDARDEKAVVRLRERKRRNEKPFALMFRSMEQIKKECRVSVYEERLLLSPETPIVLLDRLENRADSVVAESVAPGNPTLGIMAPYTPLHHILLSILDFPVVATSGNLSDEPICFDEHEALERLGGIADLFLTHDRPIVRHVDDSVTRIIADREMILRRSRGYAPLPISLDLKAPAMLAVGAHQKNTVALSLRENAIISQHIGDLETQESYEAFEKAIDSLLLLFDIKPESIVCDLHPDYMSTKFAKRLDFPTQQVQHHFAHIASCMAENHLDPPVLGVSWDGTGYGEDGSIWGGEFIKFDVDGQKRITSFRRFRLPGGIQAIKEPRRAALGILYEIYGGDVFRMTDLHALNAFQPSDLKMIRKLLETGFNSPWSSSAGRLFDAVASITGSRQTTSFEGQAAMELEHVIDPKSNDEAYPFEYNDSIDWQPMIEGIIVDLNSKTKLEMISLKFHNTLAEMIVTAAKMSAIEKIVLSGGCFQNKYLSEKTIEKLRMEGFKPYWHQRIPPNDGGIALGQLFLAINSSEHK